MLQGTVVQMRKKGPVRREGKRCTWKWIPQIVSNRFYREIIFAAFTEYIFPAVEALRFSSVNIKTRCDYGAEH
jgi:hypothetical protein